MESKILNFRDAMKLSSIVSKYIDTVSLSSTTIKEFAYTLFSRIEVEEVEQLVTLFGGSMDMQNSELILFCSQGMMKNNILDLLDIFKRIGFEN